MIVYVTGTHSVVLNELGVVLSNAGLEAHVRDIGTTPQEVYNSLLVADTVLMLYGGTSDVSTELGIAIALGKAIYVAKETSGCAPNPFLDVDGVRQFDSVTEALEALLADERGDGDEPQRENGVYGLGELGGLGTEAGGDSGSDP